ncbi:MAG: hypothetical protein Q6373_007210 [Candidatus Sigynarchaeota archaeon]
MAAELDAELDQSRNPCELIIPASSYSMQWDATQKCFVVEFDAYRVLSNRITGTGNSRVQFPLTWQNIPTHFTVMMTWEVTSATHAQFQQLAIDMINNYRHAHGRPGI